MVNGQIKSHRVKLIDADGKFLGEFSKTSAQQMAANLDLDLIEINAKDAIPLCKIADYGKFKYEQSIKEKEQSKKNRMNKVSTKEIQLRPTTGINDIKIKAKQAQKFINEGNKVVINIRFKGREISHSSAGRDVMNQILSELTNYTFERKVGFSDRSITATLIQTKDV